MRELLAAGLLDGSAQTVWGDTLADYAVEPKLTDQSGVEFRPAPDVSLDHDILRPVATTASKKWRACQCCQAI